MFNRLSLFFLKKYCKLIAVDLNKQPKLDADPKAMLEISFTGNLSRVEGTRMYFIMEGTKKNSFSFRFFKGNS